MGRLISGVALGPSPDWMKRRLIAAGMRPISNVVDVTNYVMLELGHPLHAFDFAAIQDKTVVVRRAKQGETIETLDEQSRNLDADRLVIADAHRPIAIAGVMGGANSEVGEGTDTIFLESAVFDPVSVRRTARSLGLVTEASHRFQRGADFAMCAHALDRAAELIRALGGDGSRIAPGAIDACPGEQPARTVQLTHAFPETLLGDDIPVEQQMKHLSALGFEPADTSDGATTYVVPSWRHDVSGEADLVEELARLHGYDRVPSTMPPVRQSEERFAPEEARAARLRDLLLGYGLTEAFSWTFDSAEEHARARCPADRMVRLENPLAEQYAGLRTSLVPGLLRTAALNQRRGRDSIRLFEMGPVFFTSGDGEMPVQDTHLGILLAGPADEPAWHTSARNHDFYDIKGVAEELADALRADVRIADEGEEGGAWRAGESLRLLHGETPVGRLGTVAKDVASAFDVDGDVFVLEMDLTAILRRGADPVAFAPVINFPPSLRDIAVLVSTDVSAGELVSAAHTAGGTLLQHVNIFDVYTGKQVPEGKKSVALSLVFQSPERTLTDKDTEKAWKRIVRRLQDDFAAELR
jgi:phenylalanyl-tRNA synthetase beta chain